MKLILLSFTGHSRSNVFVAYLSNQMIAIDAREIKHDPGAAEPNKSHIVKYLHPIRIWGEPSKFAKWNQMVPNESAIDKIGVFIDFIKFFKWDTSLKIYVYYLVSMVCRFPVVLWLTRNLNMVKIVLFFVIFMISSNLVLCTSSFHYGMLCAVKQRL